jgi:hypothetical protein
LNKPDFLLTNSPFSGIGFQVASRLGSSISLRQHYKFFGFPYNVWKGRKKRKKRREGGRKEGGKEGREEVEEERKRKNGSNVDRRRVDGHDQCVMYVYWEISQ